MYLRSPAETKLLPIARTNYSNLGSLGNPEILLSFAVAAAARFASLHVHALPCLSSLLTVSYIPIYLSI